MQSRLQVRKFSVPFLFGGMEAISCTLAHVFFRVHPPPAFGSSSNLEALALEANESDVCSTNVNDDNSVHLVSRLHNFPFSLRVFVLSNLGLCTIFVGVII